MKSCSSFVAVITLLVFGCVWQSNAEKCEGQLLPKGKLCTSMNDDLENCAKKHAEIMPGVTGQCAVAGGLSCVVQDRCGDYIASGPKSCYDLYEKGEKKNGVYWIQPNRNKIKVWCDMTRDGGGWTLVGKFRTGGKKGDPRKKHDVAWCASNGVEGPCSQVKPGWLENDAWPNEDMAGWLAFDDWDAIFNSGKKYFRRDDSHNTRGNYFKRITAKYPDSGNTYGTLLKERYPTLVGKPFRMSRAYFQWDHTLGKSKVDFNLVNEYSQIDQHQDSVWCNYADMKGENHYVGYERDCHSRSSWDWGVWKVDCFGDEEGGDGEKGAKKGCVGHTGHMRYSRILWVK